MIQSIDLLRLEEYLSGERKVLPRLCYEIDDKLGICDYCKTVLLTKP